MSGLGIDWKILLGQILNFVILLYLLKKFAYKPFLNTLRKREEKIKKGIQGAEEVEKRVRKIEEERREILKEAQEKASLLVKENEKRGKKKYEEIIANALAEKEKILKEAEARGERKIEAMKKAYEKNILDLSLKLAEKILREKIDVQKDKKIINDLLYSLGKSNSSQSVVSRPGKEEEREAAIKRFVSELKRGKDFSLALKVLRGFKKYIKREEIELVLAREFDEKTLEEFKKKIREVFAEDKKVNIKVDKSIIGGFQAKSENKFIDGSAKNSLDKLRKAYE